MISGKFISCKAIIAKVYRDLQIKEEEAWVDFVEWIGEALEAIHVYPQYKHEIACLKVKNYKAELPCGFIGIESINYGPYSLTYSSNPFGPRATETIKYPSDTPYSYNRKKIENAVFVDPDTINYFPNGNSIQIKNGYIYTSFKEGDLNITYQGLILDEDGFPMVPDERSFTEALFWYCNYKYTYPKARNGEINANFYTDAFDKWQMYCNQAGAEALMPDLATLENIKKSFISLRPRVNRADYFYNGLNK